MNDDIKSVLENVRQDQNSKLPKELIDKIIDAESENLDNESKAIDEIRNIIDNYLKVV